MVTSTSSLPSGTTINDRYELIRKLGADGSVYSCFDRHLKSNFAIKLIEPASGAAASWDEAWLLQQLSSDFLIPVLNADVVTNSDIRFLVTPLMNEGDLEESASPYGYSTSDAVRLARQIATGAGRIHQARMVHRDIKPGNVFKHSGDIRLGDLEFCALLDPRGLADRNGSWCTLAPEAADEGGKCSIASDVYSLGATTFYLLSGEYPVDHRLPRSAQKELIAAGSLRAIRDLAPHVSPRLARVIKKSLSKDPVKRYPSALTFSNALASASRAERSWRRTPHIGHEHCLEGAALRNSQSIMICSTRTDHLVRISSRHSPSGRRVPGSADVAVPGDQVAQALRSIVDSL